jgi:hypothetical protein
MPEPENLVLHLLQEMRSDLRQVDAKVDGLRVDLGSEIHTIGADLRSEIHSLRADVASDLLTLEYHSTAVGHGLLYSELEERVRRIEQRLEMPGAETH